MTSPQTIPASVTNWSVQLMPMIAAVLLSALWRHHAAGDETLGSFALHVAQTGLVSLPFVAAHLSAFRLRPLAALAAWLAGFALYPIAVFWVATRGAFDNLLPDLRECATAAAFSAMALLAGGRSSYRLRAGEIASLLRRLPVTLDGSMIALLMGWALATTSLFASTADAVRNQPFTVWFDPVRLASHPGEALYYLWQFAIVALLLYAFYWGSRYLLIRRALGGHGWTFFALSSLSYWIIATPLMASLVLQLPINLPVWSLLPSEDRQLFDPLNYGFTFVFLAVTMPIVLASERLLAEQRDAAGRHEQVSAELALLQQQINPHFLFNSLNTLYALCLKDRSSAADAVVKLSDLLRYTVYDGQRELVRLDEEIEYLRNYIALQLLRLGDRCVVRCNWSEVSDRLCIPPLLLIMLVENAFKHGIEPTDRASELRIDLSASATHMRFVCENSLDPDTVRSKTLGLGLANLRRRLELIFGDSSGLSSERSGEGWRAVLELELRPC